MNNAGPVNRSALWKLSVLLLFVVAVSVLHIAYNMYVVVLLLQDVMDNMSDFIDLALDMNVAYELAERARASVPDVDYVYA